MHRGAGTKSMKENALTRKHIKRNLARLLCGLDEECLTCTRPGSNPRHLQGRAEAEFNSSNGSPIWDLGILPFCSHSKGASMPAYLWSSCLSSLLMGMTPIFLTDRRASKGERQFQWKLFYRHSSNQGFNKYCPQGFLFTLVNALYSGSLVENSGEKIRTTAEWPHW